VAGLDEIVDNWEAIKRAEKARASTMDGVALSQPALALAAKVLQRVARAGLDVAMPAGDDLGSVLLRLVAQGRAPAIFAESDDPDRLVPVVAAPEDIMLAVSGDPLRTNAYVFAHNGILGYPTTKRVELPPLWPRLLRSAREGDLR